MPDIPPREVGFGNYLVAFLDLLGQRNALHGQGLLPVLQSDADRDQFKKTAINSIGSIINLQKTSEDIFQGYNKQNLSHLKELLPPETHELIDDLNAGEINTQRWSDGLVLYYCMRGSNVLRDLSAYHALITRTGSNALVGLARGQPIRGGIEVSWGVELHQNELYGPAVANAYSLESSVAQYPRIVLGGLAMDYLSHVSEQPGEDARARLERGFAQSIIELTFLDHDDVPCVHYLGPDFMVGPDSPHKEIYPRALAYIESQLVEHKGCEKLLGRYEQLHAYFRAYAR